MLGDDMGVVVRWGSQSKIKMRCMIRGFHFTDLSLWWLKLFHHEREGFGGCKIGFLEHREACCRACMKEICDRGLMCGSMMVCFFFLTQASQRTKNSAGVCRYPCQYHQWKVGNKHIFIFMPGESLILLMFGSQ